MVVSMTTTAMMCALISSRAGQGPTGAFIEATERGLRRDARFKRSTLRVALVIQD